MWIILNKQINKTKIMFNICEFLSDKMCGTC